MHSFRLGPESRADVIGDMLTASTYAGIAFGNAGCAAVHAMSYPLGAAYHVPHGEANYAMFTGVYKTYLRLRPACQKRHSAITILIPSKLSLSSAHRPTPSQPVFRFLLSWQETKSWSAIILQNVPLKSERKSPSVTSP